jgi:phage terminase large subunit GpA-like protein
VSIAKGELYGWLRLSPPTDVEPPAPGYCHFPEYGLEYFRQITAEHMVTIKKRGGFVKLEWQLLANRQNHYLDCRVYSRAAAAVLGLDRMVPPPPSSPPKRPPKTPAPRDEGRARGKPGWLRGGRGKASGNWLSKRRR